MPRIAAVLAALGAVVLAGAAVAAEFETIVLSDETELTFAVALPPDFDPAEAHPVLLALPPGPQTREMVDAGLDAYWEREGARRGFIVISPVAPNGQLFFQGSERHVPELLSHLTRTYKVEGGRFHLSGISNGGISAFLVALDSPERFQSLTVLPGFPPTRDAFAQLDRLAGLTVSMFVGARDSGWVQPMELTAQELQRVGADVHFEQVPDNGHFVVGLAGDAASQVFDWMLRPQVN